MPSAVPMFLKMADEKQVIYFTWPNRYFVNLNVKRILFNFYVVFKLVDYPFRECNL